tara:strand:- start:185 stop:1195 length:1011 start_codon:yes stop_codon:yes gene_type:complete
MAYVGNPVDTQNTFQSLQGKRFSGDGSTTDFTLDIIPGNVLDIEVFVGNVRQDPNSAYTLSGTTLSFTGAPPSGTNNIYVVHQAKSVGTIDVPTGGVAAGSLATSVLTGQTDIGGAIADADLFLLDDGAGGTLRKTAASRIKTYAGFSVSDITGATALDATPADTDEFILSDAGTLKRIDYSYIKAESNNPSFFADMSAHQGLSDNVSAKVAFNQTSFATSGTYDTSNYRFTPGVAGNYLFNICVVGDSQATANLYANKIYLFKNGSDASAGGTDGITNNYVDNYPRQHAIYLNMSIASDADDYFEVYAQINDTSGTPQVFKYGSYFSAFRISASA